MKKQKAIENFQDFMLLIFEQVFGFALLQVEVKRTTSVVGALFFFSGLKSLKEDNYGGEQLSSSFESLAKGLLLLKRLKFEDFN